MLWWLYLFNFFLYILLTINSRLLEAQTSFTDIFITINYEQLFVLLEE